MGLNWIICLKERLHVKGLASKKLKVWLSVVEWVGGINQSSVYFNRSLKVWL